MDSGEIGGESSGEIGGEIGGEIRWGDQVSSEKQIGFAFLRVCVGANSAQGVMSKK